MAIYMLTKMKSFRSDIVIGSLIVFQQIMVNFYFGWDSQNPLITIKFLYTIAFSHMMRLNSFFLVTVLCWFSTVWFMFVRLSEIQKMDNDRDLTFEKLWQLFSLGLYAAFWTFYTYWDEIKKKV